MAIEGRVKDVTIARFWRKVQKSDGCWLWKGARSHGYGAFGWTGENGKWHSEYSHRLSWTIHNGPIPKDLCVLRTCGNRLCVNPEHLFLDGLAEHMRRLWEKSRQVPGGFRGNVS